jgi:N-acetylmuramoyl-L-alanine amidase
MRLRWLRPGNNRAKFPFTPTMLTRPLLGLLLWSSIMGIAPANPLRHAPTRPSVPAVQPQTPVKKAPVPEPGPSQPKPPASAVEYLKIEDVAARYSLELSWMQPQRRVLLKDALNHIEIEAGSRDTRVNGLRVFLGDPARLVEGGMRISRIDAERLLPGLIQPLAARGTVKVVAIDPGHGGALPGTLNTKLGLQEKVLALDVSVRLKKRLEALGYRVIMTRETDIDVGWGARAIIANQAKADVFISIHFNSVLNDTKTNGTEVFTFAPQFQRSTNAWGPGQVDDTEALPAPVNQFDTLSVAFAHAIHRELLGRLKTSDRGQKIAHWGVLRPLNCPGVLVEAGFLSNEAEGRKIATPEYRQQIAEAIADGVKAYAAKLAGAKQ